MYKKKMGTALRKLKKSGIEYENGQLVKFKGRLTDNVITALNVCYGGVIRNNKNDIDGMVQAIDALFSHSRTPNANEMSEHNPLIKLAGADLKLQPMRLNT